MDNKKTKRILIFTKYGRKAASSRYRFLQYLPFLQRESIECEISNLLDDEYLEKRFTVGQRSIYHIVKGFLRRLKMIAKAKHYDLVIIYCELFPYIPDFFERYLKLRNIPYIIDFDDAIFHSYDIHPNETIRFLLKNKMGKILSMAQCVIAGNEYLADYARNFNDDVVVIPTVVDINTYKVAVHNNDDSETFVIGWIGSPSTSAYLKIIKPALKKFCANHNAKLVLIGAGNVLMDGIPLEIHEWDEKKEVEYIRQFDVGVMPLPDSPWARGKCGFKLIQYMACGLPVIASPVGTNKEIVEDGVNGFFASTTEEWVNFLGILYNNYPLREKMGESGRQKIKHCYSLQVMAPRLISIIKNGK